MTGDREVSVVIPTRGTGRGLDRAIDTATRQEDVSTRLIVVVDGEPSAEVDQRALAGLASPHRVISVSRIGVPGALRNLGLSLVRTDFVAFLDDDDWWEPSKLRKQVHMLTRTGAAIIGSNAVKVLDDKPIGLYFEDMPMAIRFEDLLATNWLITSSVMVVADVLRAVGGFPSEERLRFCDDYAAWLKTAAAGGLVLSSEPLVHYTASAVDSLSVSDGLTGEEARSLAIQHLMTTQQQWGARLSRRQRSLAGRLMGAGPVE